MKRNLNETFEQTAQAIRQTEPKAAQLDTAADHVWARIAHENVSFSTPVAQPENIRGCSDYQALLPAYLGGQLAPARTLLLEDHTRECVPCRRALKEARNGGYAVQVAPAKPARSFWPNLQMPVMRWALAACLLVGIGIVSWPFIKHFTNSVGTLSAIVEASNGNVFRVTENVTQPITVGTKLKQGEHLRTAKDAGAIVKLSDGSVIETRERSEFSLNETLDGTTINLERGQVIIQAAKQSDARKLFVATPDALVAVKGTIFAVNSGTKGARVSVVEGEVELNHGGKKTLLHPGEQAVTHESIAPIRVREEVAWSRDANRYQQLLDGVKRDIDARVALPGNRYSTRLLDLMPADTVVYAAIPNLAATLAQAQQILDENIQHNPELREWSEREQANRGKGHDIHAVLGKLTAFGQYLGAEIAIGANLEKESKVVALAEVNDANGFRAAAERQLAELNAESKENLPVLFIDDPFKANLSSTPEGPTKNSKDDHHLLLWLHDGLLVVGTELATLQGVATSLNGTANRFSASPFHARLADVYREGAGFLVAADLEKLISTAIVKENAKPEETTVLKQLGVTRFKHFIAEMKDSNGKADNRALVTYEPNQPHGVASWLAAPGPMGALQFISPDANVVAAFVVQSPTALFDDLLNALKVGDEKAWQHIQDMQTQHGINLRDDFAAALGGEFAAALDGPVLPTPAWKVVAEVNDAAKLQASLERAVIEFNKLAAEHGVTGLLWERAEQGGKTFYRIKLTTGAGEVNYAFAYGYLIAAPSRALVENAIKYRESGYTILQSSKFKAALPADKQANFSALIYQNLDSVLSPLTKKAEQLGVGKDEQHNAPEMLHKMFGQKAGLAYAYALGDRMIFSLNTEDGGALLTPSSLLGLGGFGPFQLGKEVTR